MGDANDKTRDLPPLSKKQTEMVFVRMSPELMVRMERRRAIESRKGIGKVTRSDFVRHCVERFLEEAERAEKESGDGG